MPREETPPPQHPYPFSFEPIATLQLTDDGMELVRLKDEVRIKNIAESAGEVAVRAVREQLASRIGPNNTVSMTLYDFEDTIGGVYFVSRRKLVEREILPDEPRKIDGLKPATMADDEPEFREYITVHAPNHFRPDQAPVTESSPARAREEPPKKRRWWRR